MVGPEAISGSWPLFPAPETSPLLNWYLVEGPADPTAQADPEPVARPPAGSLVAMRPLPAPLHLTPPPVSLARIHSSVKSVEELVFPGQRYRPHSALSRLKCALSLEVLQPSLMMAFWLHPKSCIARWQWSMNKCA